MLTAKRLAVVSDFHLGRPGAGHACSVPPETLIAAANALRASHDLVVVNGDLYDLERGPTPSQRRELRTLEPVHREVVSAMRGPGWAWTRGNHDRVLQALGLAAESVRVSLPCGVVHVEHGDRFNAPIKRWPPFTTGVTWVSGRVESVAGLRWVYGAMRQADALLTGAESDDPVELDSARWLAADDTLVAMVIGHTHVPLLHALPDGRALLNPGGSTDEVHALSIDGETGVATLLRWSPDGFVETARLTLGT